mgnify:CR=1 FL=1
MGTYAHTALTYNLYDKSYKKDVFRYDHQFGSTKHTDMQPDRFSREKFAVAAKSRVDTDDKTISEYSESRVSLLPTTQFLHGDSDTGAGYGLDVTQDGRKFIQGISQRAQIENGTTLHMVVKGQSYLEPGDLIEFKLISVDEKNPDGEPDPQYSGKYIITKIRHQVTDEIYTMVLECAKDSIVKPSYPGDPEHKISQQIGEIYDLYEASSITEQASKLNLDNLSVEEALEIAKNTPGQLTNQQVSSALQSAAQSLLKFREYIDLGSYGLDADQVINLSLGYKEPGGMTEIEMASAMSRIIQGDENLQNLSGNLLQNNNLQQGRQIRSIG